MTFYPISQLLNWRARAIGKDMRDYDCLHQFIKDNDFISFSEDRSSFVRTLLHTNNAEKQYDYINKMDLDHWLLFKNREGWMYLCSHPYGSVEEHEKRIKPLRKDMQIDVYGWEHSYYAPYSVLIIYSLFGSPRLNVNCKRSDNGREKSNIID